MDGLKYLCLIFGFFFRIDNGGNIFGGVGVDFYIGEI